MSTNDPDKGVRDALQMQLGESLLIAAERNARELLEARRVRDAALHRLSNIRRIGVRLDVEAVALESSAALAAARGRDDEASEDRRLGALLREVVVAADLAPTEYAVPWVPHGDAPIILTSYPATTLVKTDDGWEVSPPLPPSREAALNEELTATRKRLVDLQDAVATHLKIPVPQLHDPAGNGDIISALRVAMSRIDDAYRQRNAMVCVAARVLLDGHPASSEWGYVAGVFTDLQAEPGFRTVVALDLAGQVTFHMDERDPIKPWTALPPYHGEWDGHSDAVKWERVKAFLAPMPCLYLIGPHLYIAERETDALTAHRDTIATLEAKLSALRVRLTETSWPHVDALIRQLRTSLTCAPQLVDDETGLQDDVLEWRDDGDEGWVVVSTRSIADWRLRSKGNAGLLQDYYKTNVAPHLNALMRLAMQDGIEVDEVCEQLLLESPREGS